MKRVTLPAYAKLNLTLDILGNREDGYHDLRMVMQSVELHDDVTVALTEEDGVVCRCGEIPGDESNLAVRAARAFFAATGTPPCGLAVDIVKRIPAQAGMAGGSADAAATLRALRELLMPTLPDEALREIGTAVGSDVPYCVLGGTALAEGRGERLTPLRSAPPFHVVLCKPDFGVSTPALFARADERGVTIRPDTEAMLRAVETGDAAALCANVANAFEDVLGDERDAVLAIKARLLALRAEAAAMTGSGPTVFGLYRDESAARAAYEALRPDYAQTFLTRFV